MATVDEVVQHALPRGTRVLAGSARLGRQVTWALVLKPRPPGLEAAHGDELILLSLSTLTTLDPSLSLARALRSLADRASAVAVRGEVAPDAVDAAERLGLPLLQLPSDAPLVETERRVLRYLSEQRGEWYRRRHTILHDLTSLALRGQGLDAVAHAAADLTGHGVLLEDERGETLAWRLPDGFPAEAREQADGYLDGYAAIPELGQGHVRAPTDLARMTVPVVIGSQSVGTASLLGIARDLDVEARPVVEAVATAAAIVLTREHAVQETVHRIQGDVIGELVSGKADAQDVLRRAERLGFDLDAPHVALAVMPDGSAPRRDALLSLGKRLRRVLASYEVRAPFHVDEAVLAVFFPVERDARPASLKHVGDRLRRDLADATPGHQLVVGVSRARSGVEGLRISFVEASRAVEMGYALAPDREVTFFGDLGIYRLLFALRETAEMREFHDEMLGSLAGYDRDKHTELLPTLAAFLSANNATEVAARLNLHRNSLLYRLRRIQEITGLDLDDPETRLALHLALRVGETLESTSRGARTQV